MPTQPQSRATDHSAPSLSESRVEDAAGMPATVSADNGETARVRLSDGSELHVPVALFALQPDGSYRLPFSLQHDGDDDGAASLRIPVHEERLHVDKRTVETGRGVRVHKTVREHQQIIDMPLEHDELDVERVAIDKIVAENQLPQAREEGETLIIPVLEERLVVSKQIVLKEELRVTRRRIEVKHPQTVTVRSEQAAFERFDDERQRT